MTSIVITGMGAVSAAGIGVDALWNAAKEGRSAVSPLDIHRAESIRVRIAASVKDFDPGKYLSDIEMRRCDRFTQFAHVAVQEAIEQSGLTAEEIKGNRTACILGTGIGGMNTLDDGCFAYYSGEPRVDPFSIPRLMPSSAISHVSIAHKITGPCFTVTSACSSASQAIGVAMQMIRAGIVDRAITGGSEACITPATMRAWEMLRVLTPNACRPFAKGRNGMTIGEGAGIFILESEQAAKSRGAAPVARLAGYGTTSDARDIIQPDIDGASDAMQAALSDAGIHASDIGYVNAHGTGTILNDINEAAAIRRIFGDRTDELPVSSTKPVIGHTLGAAGGLELAVTVKAVLENLVPPQINFDHPDPKCPLHLPSGGAVPCTINAALSNSFAFGGINASLIVTKPL